ncbi:alpha/beta hydrolase [Leuconostoc litchii]|uniref:Alpha/beta hydrolase n=1 Tax=Leuconostoc litchii TaxID=1981069 RepID=A0A6P2CRC4_9LACO|nr:alpha/beta hydrolase [Leuconostoc litchii]TYC46809.1 alpha/beta hydrolase [Leuconostoc litchii]GMA70701.1 alpha/beta hydrolase [Leuconostoc litchii]
MFYEYVKGNLQWNLQINRQLEGLKENKNVKEELKTAIPKLTNKETWYQTWFSLGEIAEHNKNYKLACAYFGLAQFYLSTDDQKKMPVVHRYLDNFYQSHQEINYESYQVPYQNSFLPAIKVNINPKATKTLIIINGFDSFMEELLVAVNFFNGTAYNIILFDGPGQGRALIDNKIKFTPYFEKPISAIIDYFGLDQVDAMGVSWGGYFVIRAAAYEKRIKNVVCFDFFYDGLHTFLKDLSEPNQKEIQQQLKINNVDAINKLLSPLIKNNTNVNFLFTKGYENTGTSTPYTLLKEIEKHTIRGIGHLVEQHVLLLAGKEDQYVPFKDLVLEQQELTNVKSLDIKIFTKETGGEQHCQAGRYDLALDAIRNFLSKHTE